MLSISEVEGRYSSFGEQGFGPSDRNFGKFLENVLFFGKKRLLFRINKE